MMGLPDGRKSFKKRLVV